MTLLRKVLIAEVVWFLLAMFIAGFDPSWITSDQFGPLRTSFVGMGAIIGLAVAFFDNRLRW